MIGIIAVGTAVRDVFAKRTAQARAPPAVEVVLLSYILRGNKQTNKWKTLLVLAFCVFETRVIKSLSSKYDFLMEI